MKVSVQLTFTCKDAEARRRLQSVLSPDNEGGPRSLKLSATRIGSELKFRVEADSLQTAVSTALSILRDVRLFEEVWLLSHDEDAAVRG
ncbi:MAG TPA: hypothetical protein VGR56_03140 [Nitrososphaerales archaeon]|nr:hypothetical protein [Nitrososphaerales archaeon]